MIAVKISDIAAWCNGELFGDGNAVVTSVTKDSRDVPENSLYIALKGDRFDGNDFILQSLNRGASAAVGEIDCKTDKAYIKVKDSKKALLDIAAGYRGLFDIPAVAITGSVGKTTTKEIIAAVLSEKYNCLKTDGNLNNEIGMPLMALKLSHEHEIAVFEMGMSGFGEISNMTKIAKPDMAIISNIGLSHIGKLGSQENILKAKLEIIEGLKKGGILAVNGDDEFLSVLNPGVRCIKFGIGEINDIKGYNITEDRGGCDFDCVISGEEKHIRVNIPGIHNIRNALAAIAVGLRFNVEPEKIVSGIAKAEIVGNRMKFSEHGGINLICDCYNASPDSMIAALNVLYKEKGRKIAVLADMLELGDYAEKSHIEVGRCATGCDGVITIGKNARFIASGAESGKATEVFSFDNNKQAMSFLKDYLKCGDSVLVKGSNSMKLYEICDFIEVNFK